MKTLTLARLARLAPLAPLARLARLAAVAALAVTALSACGGGNANPPPATASSSSSSSSASSSTPAAKDSHEVATGNTLTEFQKQKLLGHYSTNDGASGFILDRTVTPPRGKLDGTDKVCSLTESHGPFDTKEYRCDDHSIWIRVDGEGRVQLFQGPKQHEGVRVVRDADANQLK